MSVTLRLWMKDREAAVAAASDPTTRAKLARELDEARRTLARAEGRTGRRDPETAALKQEMAARRTVRTDDDDEQPETKKCACGAMNPATAKHCADCGKRLPKVTVEEPSEASVAARAAAWRTEVQERARARPSQLLGVRLVWPDAAPPKALSIAELQAMHAKAAANGPRTRGSR